MYYVINFCRWSKNFSGGKEIFQYFCDFAEKFNILKYIKFNETVVSSKWNEVSKIWEITTASGKVFKGNFFVHATGALNFPRKPTFKVMHYI